jgi:hypothetical protein
LIQLTKTIPEAPFGWSVLLAPVLLASLLRREPKTPASPQGGAAPLLILGLSIEILGLAGGSPGIARLGLPIAVVGLAMWGGAPSARAAGLAFWTTPIPITVYGLTTPHLESAYAAIGAALGASLHASGPLIRSGSEHLELDPYHSGAHLVFIMTELVWYAAVRNGAPVCRTLGCMAVAAVAALPLQVLAVLVAVLLLSLGAPDAANLWLDHGLWMLTAILGVVWIETR